MITVKIIINFENNKYIFLLYFFLMKITKHSKLVVLSNIEGLSEHLASFFGESSPNISSFNSSNMKLNLQEDVQNDIRKTLSESEFFVADPPIIAEVLSFCSLDKIKVRQMLYKV